jgi:hypothetical protein
MGANPRGLPIPMPFTKLRPYVVRYPSACTCNNSVTLTSQSIQQRVSSAQHHTHHGYDCVHPHPLSPSPPLPVLPQFAGEHNKRAHKTCVTCCEPSLSQLQMHEEAHDDKKQGSVQSHPADAAAGPQAVPQTRPHHRQDCSDLQFMIWGDVHGLHEADDTQDMLSLTPFSGRGRKVYILLNEMLPKDVAVSNSSCAAVGNGKHS